jgi:hypothetical protein
MNSSSARGLKVRLTALGALRGAQTTLGGRRAAAACSPQHTDLSGKADELQEPCWLFKFDIGGPVPLRIRR